MECMIPDGDTETSDEAGDDDDEEEEGWVTMVPKKAAPAVPWRQSSS